jgi:hypothetical protein
VQRWSQTLLCAAIREGVLVPLQFVLIHSPLVGPLTWTPVAERLRARGHAALVPALAGDEDDPAPLWRQHAASVVRALEVLPPEVRPWLVGHSGAGALLPAMRDLWQRRVAGYLLVDAGIPSNGQPRRGPPNSEFARQLDALYVTGHRFPAWTDERLRPLVPDDALRSGLLAELQPQPWRFWEEPIPVFAGWPDAPCAYLHFSSPYDADADHARNTGWPFRHLPAGHFHMLVDPTAVADAVLNLAAAAERQP